jgi:hypothetical protein
MTKKSIKLTVLNLLSIKSIDSCDMAIKLMYEHDLKFSDLNININNFLFKDDFDKKRDPTDHYYNDFIRWRARLPTKSDKYIISIVGGMQLYSAPKIPMIDIPKFTELEIGLLFEKELVNTDEIPELDKIIPKSKLGDSIIGYLEIELIEQILFKL